MFLNSINYIARGMRFIASNLERFCARHGIHDKIVKKTSAMHDMMDNADESYYASQYFFWIKRCIKKVLKRDNITALDLGCGQGRLSIPLSGLCKNIIGVDFTKEAVDKARHYASGHGCDNIDFIHSDILNYVRKAKEASFDIVLLIEVTIFMPSYKETLSEILRVLKPGGAVFIAFRSQYFNILHSIRNGKIKSAKMAIAKREGFIWGDDSWFSWHTKKDIISLLSSMGYKEIECSGIGCCSGIEGDSLDTIARPSLLNEDEQRDLLDIELQIAKDYADNGRYILAIARK